MWRSNSRCICLIVEAEDLAHTLAYAQPSPRCCVFAASLLSRLCRGLQYRRCQPIASCAICGPRIWRTRFLCMRRWRSSSTPKDIPSSVQMPCESFMNRCSPPTIRIYTYTERGSRRQAGSTPTCSPDDRSLLSQWKLEIMTKTFAFALLASSSTFVANISLFGGSPIGEHGLSRAWNGHRRPARLRP